MKCSYERCRNAATHGPAGVAEVCWQHAGEFPSVLSVGAVERGWWAHRAPISVRFKWLPAWALGVEFKPNRSVLEWSLVVVIGPLRWFFQPARLEGQE